MGSSARALGPLGITVALLAMAIVGLALWSAPTAAEGDAQLGNTPATGVPIISGTALVGETLTADTSAIADADGITNVAYSYQWIRTGGGTDADITGATDSTYTLTDDDLGKTIRLKVTFNDDTGRSETLTSAATAEVGKKPEFLVSNLGVGVSGTGGIQRTLGASRPGFAQAFTTGPTTGGYTLGSVGIQVSHFFDESTVGNGLRVTLNGVADGGGPGDALCTLSNPPGFSTPGVSVFETPTGEGSCPQLAKETTYFVVIEWVNPSGTGRFALIPQTFPTDESAASDEDPGGADGWSIADQSHYLTVSANVRTWTAFVDTASFKIVVKEVAVATAMANSPATGAPVITGIAQVDETLTADTTGIADDDGLIDVSYSYQWLADDNAITGATSSSYTLSVGDVGKTIKLRVTFTDDADNRETLTSGPTEQVAAKPNSPATGLPTIGGTVRVGETLTASTSGFSDQDGLDNVEFSYQWTRNEADISGATARSYTLTAADQGSTIRVRVSFRDNADNEESLTSAATAEVEARSAPAPEPLTASLQGQPSSHYGQTDFTFELRFSEEVPVSYLTLRNHAFTVTGGTVIGAQRLTQGSNIGWRITVAPNSSADVTIVLPATTDCSAQGAVCTADGRKLSARVELTVPGPAPQLQQQQNSEATGAPTISGTLRVGETLTANTSGIADEDGLDNVSYSYQWMRGDADISGETARTYDLSGSDAGGTIRVRVSFRDDANNEESLTSAATAAVEARPPLTASIQNTPSSHYGQADLAFELHFSEELPVSYLTLRNHAFTVTGGTVIGAQRLTQGSNIGWRITVTPGSNADVTVVLPVTTDCDAQGAVCTVDGRKLSNRNEFTVSGTTG